MDKLKLYLIISQVIYAVTIALWIFIWQLSFDMFDNGISVLNASVFSFITLYPIVTIISAALAWLWRSTREWTSIFINLLPIGYVITFILFITFRI